MGTGKERFDLTYFLFWHALGTGDGDDTRAGRRGKADEERRTTNTKAMMETCRKTVAEILGFAFYDA